MNYYDIAKRLLLVHEGFELKEYRCTAGHRTIGVGWNIDAKPLPRNYGKVVNGKLTITNEEAEDLLKVSMREHWEDLVAKLPWVQSLDEWRKAAMLDLAFNMGIPTLLTFKNTLGFIREGKYKDAEKGLLSSKWAKQVDNKLGNGTGRADVISTIIATGDMSDSNKRLYKLV
jgi:lysozyme